MRTAHRVLTVFPLGLLSTSFFFDLAWLATGNPRLGVTAWYMILAGVIGSFAASLFGVRDLLRLGRGTHARSLGAWHGAGHTVVMVLFAASWLLRRDAPDHPNAIAIALSAGGVLLTVITGWLSSELGEEV